MPELGRAGVVLQNKSRVVFTVVSVLSSPTALWEQQMLSQTILDDRLNGLAAAAKTLSATPDLTPLQLAQAQSAILVCFSYRVSVHIIGAVF